MANFYTGFSSAFATDLTQEELDWLSAFDNEYSTVIEATPEQAVIYSEDGCGNCDDAGEVVHNFLKKFRKDDIVEIPYAEWCDKTRLDSFGGGTLVVDANGWECR